MEKLDQQQLQSAIERNAKRIKEAESIDPSTLEKYDPKVDAIQAAIDETLFDVFGPMTDKYRRYRRTLNWAADMPSFGNEFTLDKFEITSTRRRKTLLRCLRLL